MSRVAIVGMACRYPDAADTTQLWENVLGGRRAFRAIPRERMGADYFGQDPAAPDRHYATKAAVIEGWEFDRTRFRVSGSTFRSTDLTHWLALETVDDALRDAGFADAAGLPRATTGVVIGNTLTGEFSRAAVMRLRWPYVRRTLAAALLEEGWDADRVAGFVDTYERQYKSPFPAITEDTLAGGLANTIAGRVCNHYDLEGGGYTVDGACSSSVLAVLTATDQLSSGALDAAVVGGVDLSIDPFELVGFAKTGALSTSRMRVYDRHSDGFWPGEGCGVAVLMREEDALAAGKRIYAVITGWGRSSDGAGGMTRPEASGHRLAIDRAYRMAGYGVDALGYMEGHGTGTPLGDATELGVFSSARREADPHSAPLPVGTVKGNIGHTKAAAGIAGMLKATLAVYHGVLPPVTGNDQPHPMLLDEDCGVRLPCEPEVWPEGPRRAGVSAMGFGGINGHLTLEGHPDHMLSSDPGSVAAAARSAQDAELLVVTGADRGALAGRLRSTAGLARRLSYAELADLATTLAGKGAGLGEGDLRAAVVASDPGSAADRLEQLATQVEHGRTHLTDPEGGLFLGRRDGGGRVAFLFPGQGAPGRGDGGALRRRFAAAAELYDAVGTFPPGPATETAQPRIVSASLSGLAVLRALGIEGDAAVGHSLGELAALHWAGAWGARGTVSAAARRGRLMSEASSGTGAMASLRAGAETTAGLVAGTAVVVAGYNGPRQTVVSGPAEEVDAVLARARGRGVPGVRLKVSDAFHSEDVAAAETGFAVHLDELGEECRTTRRGLFSTVSGEPVEVGTPLRASLRGQIRMPVRFEAAVRRAAAEVDLLVEVGPGTVLTDLTTDIVPDLPIVAMRTDSDTLEGVLQVVAAAFVCGADPDLKALSADRFVRPLDLDHEPLFLTSPCEAVPEGPDLPEVGEAPPGPVATDVRAGADPLEILCHLLAERVELPLDEIRPGTRPLDELHLSSITVTHIAGEAARILDVVLPPISSIVATASVQDIAAVLRSAAGDAEASTERPEEAPGAGPWVRAFAVRTVPASEPRPVNREAGEEGGWHVVGRLPGSVSDLPAALRARLPGGGVLLAPGLVPGQERAKALHEAGVAALSGVSRLVTLDDADHGGAGLAKTLHLEHPETTVTVLQLPAGTVPDGIVEHLADDVAATSGFSEVWYDEAGGRSTPVLAPVPLSRDGDMGLGADDVILVTGGAQGITLECARHVARSTGCALALVGRSPAEDPAVRSTLEALLGAGVRARYYRADVTDRAAVAAAVEATERDLGPVTGVLHGAGINTPTPLESLTAADHAATTRTKVDGLRHVLDAVPPERLRLLVAFCSIIGRAGLPGEAHYAGANDQLRRDVERVADRLADCRCIALEWSVWAGTGMGERLDVLDSLVREGIQPIPLDEGVATFGRILATPDLPVTMTVTGRVAPRPTVTFASRRLPLLRFLEREVFFLPDVELVVEANLDVTSDPYLAEHELDGQLLFPAVMGLEAMAQVAAALLDEDATPQFHDARFERPVVVPVDGRTTIRVVALAEDDGVRVAVRSSETGFLVDHFSAVVRLQDEDLGVTTARRDASVAPVDPATDLYGTIMFQGSRFQAVTGYRRISATGCLARLALTPDRSWFGHLQPGGLLLADPAARDAFMHALQVCVPTATLLPVAVAQVAARAVPPGTDHLWLDAHEVAHDGSTYRYDLAVSDETGTVLARWTGLELVAVMDRGTRAPWVPEMLGPYLERRLGHELRVALQRPPVDDPAGPQHSLTASGAASTASVVGSILGAAVEVVHREDGRPQLEGFGVSASHSRRMTLAVVGDDPVGCDLQVVEERSDAVWRQLLGGHGMALAEHVGTGLREDRHTSATRVWAAREALLKLGAGVLPADLEVRSLTEDDWSVFSSGGCEVSTFRATVRDDGDYVVAFARRGRA
ncbi:type I polyketide synthase [Phycicoccus flavus]|uniref:type I polyketide synthase n=1 Tax=Phycicoccus flavus TaxID=2502783 RepID=UPI00197C0744|nr:type I polyketide synthase [Phycicoccus flavus]